jgi:hypothetical protein
MVLWLIVHLIITHGGELRQFVLRKKAGGVSDVILDKRCAAL